MKRYEYKIIDTGKHVEDELNELGKQAGASSASRRRSSC